MGNQMQENELDKDKIKQCYEHATEYLRKAADLQETAGRYCAAGDKDKAKAANFDTMGYLFAAIKHIKKAAKHSVGIKCCEKNK